MIRSTAATVCTPRSGLYCSSSRPRGGLRRGQAHPGSKALPRLTHWLLTGSVSPRRARLDGPCTARPRVAASSKLAPRPRRFTSSRRLPIRGCTRPHAPIPRTSRRAQRRRSPARTRDRSPPPRPRRSRPRCATRPRRGPRRSPRRRRSSRRRLAARRVDRADPPGEGSPFLRSRVAKLPQN